VIIVACDPGLASVGWAVLDLSGRKPRCIRAWTQRTERTPESRRDTQDRIAAIRWTLTDAALNPTRERAVAFIVEDQAPGQIAARKLGRTDANAAVARDVQHQLTGKAEALGLMVVTLAPRTWRATLGLSRATDKQIKRAARMLCDGVPERLSIHAAEAICIGVAARRRLAVNR
jgi:Holliday junction resolvasome RuvABC endonuclease subunit